MGPDMGSILNLWQFPKLKVSHRITKIVTKSLCDFCIFKNDFFLFYYFFKRARKGDGELETPMTENN